MRIILTGDLGFSVDSEEVFSELDTKLLLATVLLVLFLLGAIYRAVLVALTPLLVVFFAYTVATAFVYLYAESGATVSSSGTTILVVLMFGVGTDYCLLLVSRYREELRRIEDKHDAMARAGAHGSDDPRQRAHGVAGDADPGASRRPPHLHPRPGGRDRGRLRDGRRADPAAGAAHDFRSPRLLAADRSGRVRPDARRGEAPGRLAADRRPRPATAGGGARDHLAAVRRRSARPPRLQGRLLDHHVLQEVGRVGRGVRAARGGVPGRPAGADDGARPEHRRPDNQGRRRHRGAGRRGRRRRRHRDADRRGLNERADGNSRRGPRGRPVHEGGVRRRPSFARASRTSAPG